jgi:hypothetical protein
MPKPAIGIRRRHGGQRSRDGGVQSLTGPGFGLPQGRLERRPARVNGREIRRRGRHIAPPGPTASQGLLEPDRLMCPQMVHDDAIAGDQGRPQHVRDRGATHLGVSRTIDGHHRLEALRAEGTHHRAMLAVVLGHTAHDPLTCGGATIQARPRNIDARFINTLQALEVEGRDTLGVGRARRRDPWCVLLAGVERRFVRGKPTRGNTRHLVGTLTRTPVSAVPPAHRSCSVASG